VSRRPAVGSSLFPLSSPMTWVQARKFLRLAARRRPDERTAGEARRSPRRVGGMAAARASSLCIASGKGGTGKSVLTAALAQLFAERGRTLVVDADMGVGNAHLLQGVSPERSFVDVVEGRAGVRDVLTACRARIDLLAAGSGVSRMAGLSEFELQLIADGLEELEREYRYVLVDSAAGISEQTVGFAAACDRVLIVTTPDLTAITDAYAFLKVLLARRPCCEPLLVVNRVEGADEAARVAERLCQVSERFLGRAPTWLGFLVDDPAVRHSVNQRAPVVELSPGAAVSADLRQLAVRVLEELSSVHAGGLGRRLLEACDTTARPA